MTRATRIATVAYRALDIPLIEPFGIASGTQTVAANALVAVRLAGGAVGWGEAAPFPAVSGETQASALAALERARPLLEGEDAARWRRIASLLAEALGHEAAARCALETAVLDAFLRAHESSMLAFFGGAERSLETDMTITTGDAAAARAAAAAIRARGIRAIKLKIGAKDLDREVERAAAVRAELGSGPLILDGNCAYSAADAIRLLRDLAGRGVRVDLLEQPTGREDLDGLAEVAREGGVPIAADESVRSAADVFRIARAGAAAVVNVKLMKCGIAEALDVASAARATGLGLMIGGMVESVLAMTASACFAAGQGGFSFVDLDTPWFLAENPFEGGYEATGGRLDLGSIRAGHGVRPRL